jgi:hypothetical protein
LSEDVLIVGGVARSAEARNAIVIGIVSDGLPIV